MNYSHAFHAGNFADIVKHAGLLAALARLQAHGEGLGVIDTHGGRGLYDLAAPEARRSAEAERGVARLMEATAAPAPIRALQQAVRTLNEGPVARFYPGSPRLVADRLRPGDSLVVFELNPREASALVAAVGARAGVEVRGADGYDGGPDLVGGEGRRLVLIDPPFERGDDYARCAQALSRIRVRAANATVMIWAPLKDLETFDAFLRDLEGCGELLIAEVRLRPLRDPLRMNGCALVIAGAPPELDSDLETLCAWTVAALGEGGAARVWRQAC
ncbi:MAG: 23S rRNA (adenine(2030)-N(6))-methyltransferase RlmJ [Phenylobacterium sp.]